MHVHTIVRTMVLTTVNLYIQFPKRWSSINYNMYTVDLMDRILRNIWHNRRSMNIQFLGYLICIDKIYDKYMCVQFLVGIRIADFAHIQTVIPSTVSLYMYIKLYIA